MLLATLASCDAGSQTAAPGPAAPQTQAGAPLGDPPPAVAEPDTLPDRGSPEALLRSVIAARTDERVPLAYLARAERPTAGKTQLDKLDEARAHRHFRMRAMDATWSQVAGALAAGAMRVTLDGDRATAAFDTGGALGTSTLSFERVDGQWYLVLGN
jgi:hypothetical protein